MKRAKQEFQSNTHVWPTRMGIQEATWSMCCPERGPRLRTEQRPSCQVLPPPPSLRVHCSRAQWPRAGLYAAELRRACAGFMLCSHGRRSMSRGEGCRARVCSSLLPPSPRAFARLPTGSQDHLLHPAPSLTQLPGTASKVPLRLRLSKGGAKSPERPHLPGKPLSLLPMQTEGNGGLRNESHPASANHTEKEKMGNPQLLFLSVLPHH